MSSDFLSDGDRRAVRKGAWFGMKWTTAIVVFFVVLTAVVGISTWAFGVWTAEIKGKGEAHKKKESAGNRIFQQQFFEDAYQAVKKDQQNVAVARAAFERNPSAVNDANVAGTQQICNSDVAEYNASAEKYLAKEFRRAELPDHIDPATTCR